MLNKMPAQPTDEPNMRYGGYASDKCPRCGFLRNKKESNGRPLHGVPELVDSENLRQVLCIIDYNLRQDEELTGDPRAAFMMGVLEASVGGKQYYLVGSSGMADGEPTTTGWIQPK